MSIDSILENPEIDDIKSKPTVEDAELGKGWKNPPTVQDLKDDVKSALPMHQEHTTRVSEWLKLLEGKPRQGKGVEGRSVVQPKLIRKQAEWRYAALSEPFLSSSKLFEAKPVTWEDTQAGKQNTLILNDQFNNKINKVSFIDEYIRTLVDEGTCIIKTGWEFSEELRDVEVPVYAQPPMQGMMQGQPQEPVQIGTRIEKQMVTVYNRPTVEICNYQDVVIDPTCLGNIEKASFVRHSFETTLAALKADGRYSNLDSIDIESNTSGGLDNLSSIDSMTDSEVQTASSFKFKDKPRKKFVAHEYWGYWDIQGNDVLVPILAVYVGDTLIRLEENPYPDQKIPFVAVQYLPVRKSLYGEPDAELLKDNQDIIGALVRGSIDLMGRSANAQQAIRKDALDAVNKRRFEKGEDYYINGNIDPRQAIYMHTYPEIPNSVMNMLQMQNNEAESLTGVRAFADGINGVGLGNTATAVRSAMDAAGKRELGILRRITKGLVDIGHKFMAMNVEFLSEQEVVRITNEEFVTVDRNDLYGATDLDLTISTIEADNEKAQELAFMLQTMGNTVDPSISMKLLAKIATLRKMPELAHDIENYQPQPDPMQQEMQQLEIEERKANIEKTRAEAQEIMATAQYKMQSAQATQAKTEHTKSATDMMDLEFLRKQDGIDHKEQLEAESNKTMNKIDEAGAKAMLDYQQQRALASTSKQDA